ncbi:MAG TPA: ATP-binding cassette domain-containing protein [Clostridiaceae bacterium]|nr:ATP-binding cassette domain-containing protein [Clostridiaceae bacterium]
MIKFENIIKHFNIGTVDEVVLFNNFNLEISRGEFVSIVGSNGSGKTTLLNILCGSTPIDGGHIYVNGRDVGKLSEHERAAFIGRVFQNPQMGTCPELTILENMALADNKKDIYGLKAAINRRRIDEYRTLLEYCGMGLENRLNTPVGSLSGGQRQALALVIANMTEIELLILDEHTAALDPKSSETVMQLTDKIIHDKGVTTLMVTHNLRYALTYGDRLLMMHEGKIVMDLKGKDKNNASIDDLLVKFNEISIECGN